MTSTPVITLLASTLAALVAGVFALLATPVGQKFLTEKVFKHHDPKQMGAALDAGAKLSELCRKFINFPGIKKASIIQTNNGGGIPHPGCVLYATLTYPEEFRDNLRNQPLDAEYSAFVSETYKEGQAMIITSELREGGLLRSQFESHQIHKCELISLKKYTEKYFLLAIDYTDYDLTHSNAYAKEELRKLIHEINNVMNV